MPPAQCFTHSSRSALRASAAGCLVHGVLCHACMLVFASSAAALLDTCTPVSVAWLSAAQPSAVHTSVTVVCMKRPCGWTKNVLPDILCLCCCCHAGAIHNSSSSLSSEAGASYLSQLDDWILSNLEQHKLRRARVAALTKAAQPFQYERAEVMLVIGTRMSTSVK